MFGPVIRQHVAVFIHSPVVGDKGRHALIENRMTALDDFHAARLGKFRTFIALHRRQISQRDENIDQTERLGQLMQIPPVWI